MDCHHVFKKYCRRDSAGRKGPLLDNAQFLKLGKSTGIFDTNLTETHADVIFNAVKSKDDRKITYYQFIAALRMMGDIKFPGDEERLDKMKKLVLANEPNIQNDEEH